MGADKKLARLRRARRTRAKLERLEIHRLCVHRTPRHIYAQVLKPGESRVIVSASTVERAVREEAPNGGNAAAARVVGRILAERARAAGVERLGVDRSGFKYHGRIRALVETLREQGLAC
jgi:large subunit ribosomal protein L18